MKKIFTLFFLVGLSHASLAQQDPHFTQYMLNYLFYNPAYAGIEGVTKVSVAHRTQWAGYSPTYGTQGAPNTQYIGISAPIYTKNMGIGFIAMNDRIATNNRLDFLISGTYLLDIKGNKLSLGTRIGVVSRGYDFSGLVFNNPDDPLNNPESLIDVRPDLSLGAYWRAEKYFVGVSFNHLAKGVLPFSLGDNRTPLATHAYAIVGYDFEPNSSGWLITPSVLLKSDLNTYSFDAGVVATKDDRLWGGLTWRQSEAFNLLLGYNLLKDKRLGIGYSFDLVYKATDAKELTSHEVSLSYVLPQPDGSGRKSVVTPRFNEERN